jgi:hypothetical protein
MMFLQFRCPGTKNKKIAPFAKQTSLDHVLKNKKKEEFGPMTCREFYLKFQYLIRLEDKGAPFGIQLVSHSLCMDLVTVGQAPCIIHFLFFFIFSTSIHIIYLLDLVSTLASKLDNDNQTEAIPADRMMIKRHPSPRLL